MKDMHLKQPSPCCQAPTLAWDREKQRFICPCRKMQVNEWGKVIDTTKRGGRKGGRRKKGAPPTYAPWKEAEDINPNTLKLVLEEA